MLITPAPKKMSIPIQPFRHIPIRDDLRQNRDRGDVILDADGTPCSPETYVPYVKVYSTLVFLNDGLNLSDRPSFKIGSLRTVTYPV